MGHGEHLGDLCLFCVPWAFSRWRLCVFLCPCTHTCMLCLLHSARLLALRALVLSPPSTLSSMYQSAVSAVSSSSLSSGAGLNEIKRQSCQRRVSPAGTRHISGKTLVSLGIWVPIYTQASGVLGSHAMEKRKGTFPPSSLF